MVEHGAHHQPGLGDLLFPVINFAIFAFLLMRFFAGPIREYFRERTEQLLDGLEAGRRAQQEAQQLRAEIDRQMRELPAPAPEVLQALSPLTYLRRHPERLPPIFIARMEHDIPGLNIAVDAFVAAATAVQAPVEVMNHPEGHHGFDTEDNDKQSRAIIAQTLTFMHRHLERV